jgi:hypothetical protein
MFDDEYEFDYDRTVENAEDLYDDEYDRDYEHINESEWYYGMIRDN